MQSQPTTTTGRSIFSLIGNLAGETKTLVRQEVQLAKTELSEKASYMGRNALVVAIGGLVAYAGLIVFLIGVGVLIAWAITEAGLKVLISSVIGIGGLGLIITIVGALLLLRSVKKLKEEPLAPERTIQTLQDLKSAPIQGFERPEPAPVSSEEMQARVERTEERLSDNLSEIGDRLNPAYINAQLRSRIQAQPYRAGLIAAVVGVVGGMVLRKKFRRT